VLLEVLLDGREHLIVDEACDGVLHELFVLAEQAAYVVEVERVERPARPGLARLGGEATNAVPSSQHLGAAS
jgi:hypothetical protein